MYFCYISLLTQYYVRIWRQTKFTCTHYPYVRTLYNNMYTCMLWMVFTQRREMYYYIYIRIYIVYSNCLFLPYKKRPPGSHSLISPDHVKEDSLISTHLNRRQLILYIYKRADAAFLCKLMIINNRFLLTHCSIYTLLINAL